MKIENAQTTLFSSKEQYLNFVKAWKQYHAEGKHKRVEVTKWDGSIHRESNLTCEHHLLYNLLRGKDITKMFQATDKHEGQGSYWAFSKAKDSIAWKIRLNKTDELLAPFAGIIDKDTLVSISEIIKEWKL